MQEEAGRFEALVARYAHLIRSAVARVAGPKAPMVGEDVEQEILLALWKALGGERTPDHPASYIYRTAVRETVRILERLRRERTVDLEAVNGLAHGTPGPEVRAASRELGREVVRAIGKLAPDRARAVRAHLAGYDVREVMEVFGWSYNRARNLISRGMADLRRELRRRGLHD